jgi:hypothetical protein
MYFDYEVTKKFIDAERNYSKNQEHIGTTKILESIMLYLMD